jgi:hypothetical protein
MTLANAPLSARDAQSSAPDLPDGASEIFLPAAPDTPQFEGELICQSGSFNASQAVLIDNRAHPQQCGIGTGCSNLICGSNASAARSSPVASAGKFPQALSNESLDLRF